MAKTQTPESFCIWLLGFLDGAGENLNADQLAALKAKLDSVFTHFEPKPDSAFYLSEEFWKEYEESQRRKTDKLDYDEPPVPQTLPTFKPLPHWPPLINC